MWGYAAMYQKKATDQSSQKRNLGTKLKAYSRHDCLNREDLKNVFESLGAYNPYKQADEALSVADKNGDYIISCSTNSEELGSLIDYVFTKGKSAFKYLEVE